MADAQSIAALHAAAAAAGMTPEKYVALSGRVTLQQWEAARKAEGKATKGAAGKD